MRLEFRADGTASFVASQLRFGPLSQTAQGLRGNTASASTAITRSWEYHWTWQAAGSRLTMQASSPGVVSEYALSVLTVPEMPAQLVRKRFRHELPDIPTPERIKYFVCEGGQLKISTSANRNPTYYRYPHFGVFVRQ